MQIGIITGSRAEYGLLENVIREFEKDTNIITKIIATGAHVTGKYLDIHPHETVEMLLDSKTPNGINKSIALGIITFAELFKYNHYDAIIVLGDRFEIYAATIAAYNVGIPIMHISGGEETAGSLDNGYRHAISIFSDMHLVAHQAFKNRLINMGINPDTIHIVGSLGVDGLIKRRDDWKNKNRIMVCYYPDPSELMSVLDDIMINHDKIIIKPNPDIDYNNNIGSSFYRNDFIEILKDCDFMIGNSSAGIIEAPALGIPTINIGDRQKGRPLASSIICCEFDKSEIKKATNKVLSDEFQESLKNIYQPYQGRNVAKQIKEVICKKILLLGRKT